MAIFKGGKRRDDTFVGGDKADRFEFAANDLTGGDTIVGGGGNDTLAFTKAGKIAVEDLANVSGIERVELADGGMTFAVTRQLATTGTDGRLTVVGGAGSDTIDASRVNAQAGDQFAGAVTLLGGAGNDTLIGGDDARLVFDGGEGRDTIRGVRGTVVYDESDVLVVMSARGTLRVAQAVVADLTRGGDQTDGDSCSYKGFTALDASASTEAVVVTAGQGQSVIGGKGADRITGATEITGGGGADVLIGSESAATRFTLNEGDFARGESILGRSGSDTLAAFGRADFTKGSIAGIHTLAIAATAQGHAGVATVSGAQAAEISYLAGAGELVVEMGREHALDLRNLHDMSSGEVGVTVHGTTAADEIYAVEYTFGDGPGLRLTIEGRDGDDLIWANADATLLDGGSGNDTLRLVEHFGVTIEIDLSRDENQGVSGVGVVKGFENVSLANGATVTAIIHGSAEANVITGSFGHSTIFGEGGDDVLAGAGDLGASATLDGGAGNDTLRGTAENASSTMTGGQGEDAFRWSYRSSWALFDQFDVVTDFRHGEDRLEFVRAKFGFTGEAFDTRVVDRDGHTDLSGADLVIYTGGVLDDANDVSAYLDAHGDSHSSGFFIAGTNDQGHTVLFHALTGYSGPDNITAIADFGAKPIQLALTDFAFI